MSISGALDIPFRLPPPCVYHHITKGGREPVLFNAPRSRLKLRLWTVPAASLTFSLLLTQKAPSTILMPGAFPY